MGSGETVLSRESHNVQEAKKFSLKNKKDLGMACHPQISEETGGNVITQPRSHPSKEMLNLGMGWDLGCLRIIFFASCL